LIVQIGTITNTRIRWITTTSRTTRQSCAGSTESAKRDPIVHHQHSAQTRAYHSLQDPRLQTQTHATRGESVEGILPFYFRLCWIR